MENEEMNMHTQPHQVLPEQPIPEYMPEHKKVDMAELVKKYKNNTATPEEVAYVEDRVQKARKLSKMRLRTDKYVPLSTRLKNFIIVLLVIVGLVASLTAIGYFKVSAIARDNMVVTKTGSKDMLYEFIGNTFSSDAEVQIVKESRKLVYCIPLERSYYLYEYKITVAGKGAYIVTIDSYSELMEYKMY